MAPPAFFPSSSSAGARSQSVHRPNSQSSTTPSGGSHLYRPPTTVTTHSPKDPSAGGPIDYDTPASHIGSSTTSPTNLSLWDVAQAKEAALSNLGRGGAAMKPTVSANSPSDLQPDPIDLGKLELLKSSCVG